MTWKCSRLCLYIVQSFPPYQKFLFHRYQCNDSRFVGEPVCDHLWLLNKRIAVVRNLLTFRMGDGKPNVMFVLGGPGAGKGTQCARSARFYCTKKRKKMPPLPPSPPSPVCSYILMDLQNRRPISKYLFWQISPLLCAGYVHVRAG